jgi:hypothetical protein
MNKKQMVRTGAAIIVTAALAIAGYSASQKTSLQNAYPNPVEGTGGNLTINSTTDLRLSGKWAKVTIPASISGTANDPIEISGAEGNQVQCIEVKGNYVTVSGLFVTNCSSHGILVSGKYIKILNNTVTGNVTENGKGTCPGTGQWGSGLKIMVGAEDVLVQGNQVYENCGEGIGITRGVNVVVANNTVRDNFSVNIYIDNSNFVTIQNNLTVCTGIYLRDGHRPSGIVLGEEYYSGWGAQRHDNDVIGNTSNGCYDGVSAWMSKVGGTLKNVKITGNVVMYSTHRSISILSVNDNVVVEDNRMHTPNVYIVNSAGVTVRNNIVYGVGTVIPETTGTPVTFTRTPFVISPTVSRTRTPTITQPGPSPAGATRTSTRTITPTVTKTLTPSPTVTLIPTMTRTMTPTPTKTPIMPTPIATFWCTTPPAGGIEICVRPK